MDKERPNLHLTQFLPYRINLLAKRISTSLSTIYTQEFGITISEWRVLLWLNTYPNLYAKDICNYTYMDKTQVSRIISQLVDRNLIQRQLDDDDQRSMKLSLTENGRDLLDEIIPKAIDWENKLIESLNTPQYRDLLNIIETLEAQIDKIEQHKEK